MPTPPSSLPQAPYLETWWDKAEAEAVLETWSEEDERELERAKHAIAPLIVEDEENDGVEPTAA